MKPIFRGAGRGPEKRVQNPYRATREAQEMFGRCVFSSRPASLLRIRFWKRTSGDPRPAPRTLKQGLKGGSTRPTAAVNGSTRRVRREEPAIELGSIGKTRERGLESNHVWRPTKESRPRRSKVNPTSVDQRTSPTNPTSEIGSRYPVGRQSQKLARVHNRGPGKVKVNAIKGLRGPTRWNTVAVRVLKERVGPLKP